MFKNLPEKIFTPETMLEKKFLKFLLSNMDNENIKDELKLFSIIFEIFNEDILDSLKVINEKYCVYFHFENKHHYFAHYDIDNNEVEILKIHEHQIMYFSLEKLILSEINDDEIEFVD